ncbi:hypothetical protein D3C83_97710 [compost metagenome]
MTFDELRTKFEDNASGFLSADERQRLVETTAHLDELDDVRTLVDATVAGMAAPGRRAHV